MVEVEDQNCWGNCFEKYYKEIFRNEVGEYIRHGEEWPELSLELFQRWFTYEYHEFTYDLSNESLKVFDE